MDDFIQDNNPQNENGNFCWIFSFLTIFCLEQPEDDGKKLDDLLEDGDLDQSLVVDNLYIQDFGDNTSRRSKRRSRKALDPDELAADAEVAAAFADPYDGPGLTDLPPRPISQMSYEELVTFHLKKYDFDINA